MSSGPKDKDVSKSWWWVLSNSHGKRKILVDNAAYFGLLKDPLQYLSVIILEMVSLMEAYESLQYISCF